MVEFGGLVGGKTNKRKEIQPGDGRRGKSVGGKEGGGKE